ncbi:MAG: GntP family permease [Thermoguttaceae bacterium]|nr:GntP family permease [Thermoguttaceae bacterium]
MTTILHDPLFILVLSLIVVIGSIVWLRIGAFFALLLGALSASFWRALLSDGELDLLAAFTAVTDAMGSVAGRIALLIVFGALIGKLMTDNGSADRIVLACLRLFGEKRAPVALTSGAFILSIPVFYDATFYLLLPLAKSLYRSVRRNYVFYLLAVGLGATISHTVIPPTPGPIVVADTLGVPLNVAMGIGIMVGVCMCPVAIALAWLMNRILPNPVILQEVADELESKNVDSDVSSAALPRAEELPPLWLALAPIVAPVVLIVFASVLSIDSVAERFGENNRFVKTAIFLGSANVALGVAAIIAALTSLASRQRPTTRSELSHKISAALTMAGTIILITAMGGAYGAMLRESGIGDRIEALFSAYSLSGVWALVFAFIATAALKTAQGSSTTAMITSASIFAAMNLTGDALGCNPAYLVATIGVGSSVASWMNDSGFCVFSRSSGVSEVDCLKVWTLGTGLLGCCGFVIILILSRVFPFV